MSTRSLFTIVLLHNTTGKVASTTVAATTLIHDSLSAATEYGKVLEIKSNIIAVYGEDCNNKPAEEYTGSERRNIRFAAKTMHHKWAELASVTEVGVAYDAKNVEYTIAPAIDDEQVMTVAATLISLFDDTLDKNGVFPSKSNENEGLSGEAYYILEDEVRDMLHMVFGVKHDDTKKRLVISADRDTRGEKDPDPKIG